MPFMVRVGEGIEKVKEPGDSAAVFRRTGEPAVDTKGIGCVGVLEGASIHAVRTERSVFSTRFCGAHPTVTRLRRLPGMRRAASSSAHSISIGSSRGYSKLRKTTKVRERKRYCHVYRASTVTLLLCS